MSSYHSPQLNYMIFRVFICIPHLTGILRTRNVTSQKHALSRRLPGANGKNDALRSYIYRHTRSSKKVLESSQNAQETATQF